MNRSKVFVVDDEAQICELLQRILTREGYAVRAFTSGRDAVDHLASGRPDVIVTDLMMPGLSGLDVVRKARGILPDVGAVLTTGYASIDNVVDAMRSGVDDFVTKPFSVAEIRDVVARVLEASRVEPEPAALRPRPLTADAVNDTLTRRFRDLSLIESIHGLLADEFSSAELVPRCDATLAAALGAGRAVLCVPGARDGTFRIRSASPPHGPWSAPDDLDLTVLSLVVGSGIAQPLSRESVGPLLGVLDAGAVVAAPLCPRDPKGEDSGVLVVSRPMTAGPFEAAANRALGALASAVGDVFRALRTAERAEDSYVASLDGIVAATEARSPWFAHHADRVRGMSLALGAKLRLSVGDLEILEMASGLLDLGRVKLPDGVLGKPGRPSADEWRTLRQHAVLADDLVRPLGRLRHAKPVIRHHHENWDGSGYPDGLSRESIPHLAAIVRITDTYAALTSARAWRPAVSARTAVLQIVEMSGRHFHPQFVAAFAEMQPSLEDVGTRAS